MTGGRERGPQSSLKESAREIGFNDEVTVAGDRLHVQTEVLTRQSIEIRSVVLKGGNVLRVFAQTCPDDVALEELRAIAGEQHRRALGEVARVD